MLKVPNTITMIKIGDLENYQKQELIEIVLK